MPREPLKPLDEHLAEFRTSLIPTKIAQNRQGTDSQSTWALTNTCGFFFFCFFFCSTGVELKVLAINPESFVAIKIEPEALSVKLLDQTNTLQNRK
jgi:hypothetical protein